MKKMSFTKKMMLALAIGLGFGLGAIFLREYLVGNGQAAVWKQIDRFLFADITQPGNEQAVGIFFIVGQLFLRALQMVLVPLIFTSIIKAIQHIRDTQLLSQLAKKTLGNFLFLTGISLAIAAAVGMTAFKLNLFELSTPLDLNVVTDTQVGGNPLMVILNTVNPNIIQTLGNNGSILAVVFLGILVGLGFQKMGDKMEVLHKAVIEVHDLTMMFLSWIITNVGPAAIAMLLIRTFASYGIQYLQPAFIYMALTTVTLLFVMGVVYPVIIALIAKVSPLPFLKKMYKVAVFGFSTSSSAATLPLCQETIINEIGVDETIASFVVPLGSSLNMTGTAIMQVIATLFIASVAGYEVGIVELISILILAFIGSISTPAAPGAGAILLFTIISGMGYGSPEALAAYSFILAINRPVEMLVTAVNVVDDSVSSIMIAKSLGKLDEEIYNMDVNEIERKVKEA